MSLEYLAFVEYYDLRRSVKSRNVKCDREWNGERRSHSEFIYEFFTCILSLIETRSN